MNVLLGCIFSGVSSAAAYLFGYWLGFRDGMKTGYNAIHADGMRHR